MSLGFVFLGLGYLVIAFGVKGVGADVKVSMMWLVGLYLLHTFGELCLSPIGLSAVSRLSPPRFASLMMGVWYLASAAANKLAGVLSGFYPEAGKPTPVLLGYRVTGLHEFFVIFVVDVGRGRRGAVPAGAAHLALEPRPGLNGHSR